MKTIDTRGKLCPMPLIIFKREIKDATEGEHIEILTDNDMACQNLIDYINELGITPIKKEENGITKLSFTNSNTSCKIIEAVQNEYIVILNSDTLGKGDEDLGRVLMKAFVNTIENLDKMPSKIICYNSGVKLLIKGNDTANTLEKLHKVMGIQIMACGTCIDFYGLKEKLIEHKVVNMFNILDLQSKASNIIYP